MKTEKELMTLAHKLDIWLGDQDISRIEAVVLLEIAKIGAYSKMDSAKEQ